MAKQNRFWGGAATDYVALDNMPWSGAVADMTDMRPDTLALRALNAKIHADARVDVSPLPIGDGLLLARRR